MSIRVECLCGKKFVVKGETAGCGVKCPACATLLKVPNNTESNTAEAADDSALDETGYGSQRTQRKPGNSPRRSTSGSSAGASPKKLPGGGRIRSKVSGGKNRMNQIVLAVGISVCVIGVTARMLWPSGPINDTDGVTADSDNGTTSDSNTASTASLSQPPDASGSETTTEQNALKNSMSIATTSSSTESAKLDGDLKQLQGAWQVTDMAIDANRPPTPKMIAKAKQMVWVFEGRFLVQKSASSSRDFESNAYSVTLGAGQYGGTLDLNDIGGTIEESKRTRLAAYRLSGDELTVCIASPGSERPKGLTPDFSLGQGTLTFTRVEDSSRRSQRFNYEAWMTGSLRLKELNVYSMLSDGDESYSDVEHVALAGSLETVDGLIPADIWTVLSIQSHVALRFSDKAVVTDATLQQISQHSGLTVLSIDGPHVITSDGVRQLLKCRDLSTLIYYSKTTLSPEILNSFTDISGLKFLRIVGQSNSRQLMPSIVRAKNLRELGLYECDTTDDDLIPLAALTSLESLDLQKTRVTDRGMAQIRSMPQLRTLFLSENVTDRGLEQLAGLDHLETLFLDDAAKVTDKGLLAIRGLTNLKLLAALSTSISQQAWSDFEAAMPECRVIKANKPDDLTASPVPAVKELADFQSEADFEGSQLSHWEISTWKNRPSQVSVSSDVFHEGSGALRIQVTEDADDVSVYQAVAVIPNSKYRLTGWIRTEGVMVDPNESGTTGAILNIFDREDSSESILGTSDWKQVTLEFHSGDQNVLNIGCRLGHHGRSCTGTAWFDDLKLEKVE